MLIKEQGAALAYYGIEVSFYQASSIHKHGLNLAFGTADEGLKEGGKIPSKGILEFVVNWF